MGRRARRPGFNRQHWTGAGKPKQAFETLAQAIEDLRQRRLLGRRRAYRCRICERFHTGRKPR